MSTELVMPSNHLILCRPLLLPSSIYPSIRVFSNESALCIRWPKYWSFSFSFSNTIRAAPYLLSGLQVPSQGEASLLGEVEEGRCPDTWTEQITPGNSLSSESGPMRVNGKVTGVCHLLSKNRNIQMHPSRQHFPWNQT